MALSLLKEREFGIRIPTVVGGGWAWADNFRYGRGDGLVQAAEGTHMRFQGRASGSFLY